MEVVCSPSKLIYRQYVYPIIFSIAAISVFPAIYCSISAYIKDKLKTPRVLFYFGILFYSMVIIFFVSKAIYYRMYCSHGDEYEIFDIIPYYLYSIQSLMLVIFLFIKLLLIFNDTAFKLSKWTIGLYSTLVIIALSFALCGQTLVRFAEGLTIGLVIWLISTIIYVFIIIWLNGLFLYKLYIVHKSCQDDFNKNEDLMELITKTATLCFISTSWIIVFFVTHFLLRIFESPYDHFYFANRIAVIGDVYMNFVSILLSYNYFDPLYFKICGCCHRKCHSCWSRCAEDDGKREQELKLDEIVQSNSTMSE